MKTLTARRRFGFLLTAVLVECAGASTCWSQETGLEHKLGDQANYVFYLGVGPVMGNGKVVQVDPQGVELDEIALSATPYGVATYRKLAYVALPGGRKVVRISDGGKKSTFVAHRLLPCPIDVAVQATSGDVVVSDNESDVILRLDSEGAVQSTLELPRSRVEFQNCSVAVTVAGRVVLGCSNPRGTFFSNPRDRSDNRS